MKNKKKKEGKNSVLFETSTIIDKDEFKRFQSFYLNKYKSSLLPKVLMIFLALLIIVINCIKGEFRLVILVVVLMVAYPILLNITLNKQIDKRYNDSKRINMLEEKIMFFDKFFESKSKLNFCCVNYDEIYRIFETKKNFYIFIRDNQAFIIIKNNLNDIDGFRNFIMDKGQYKKY